MAAINNITIKDGSAIVRTYSPMSITGENSTWVDRATSSIVQGQSSFTLTFSPANAKRNTDKATLNFALPRTVTNSTTGVTSVESVGRFVNGVFIIPPTWSATERGHLYALVASLFDVLQSTVIRDAVVLRSPPF